MRTTARISHKPVAVALLVLVVLLTDRAPAQEVKGGPPEFKHLKYRSIGPAAGGRVSRACGVPGDPLTYYFAGAASGVWKSTDGGVTWKPIFDDQPVSSIGSIAVAPSDPNIIYVGSGEANIRGNVAAGNGIYKSTDAGKTWKHVWKQEGQIGTLIVHPTNPDIAFAAVLGHAFGPNPERGIYRTTDGGKTWQRVLYKDPDTGASDVCFDPSNPRILFAGLWQARRRPWELVSGGPGSGLYVSRDGGDTWKRLGGAGVPKDDLKGLPEGIYGKVTVAVAPSDPRRVYALIEAEKGGLYRSDDGGENWKLINGERYLRIRPWYFSVITVDPRNADVVWACSLRLLKSIDGGKTFRQVKGPHHVDHHDLWIDPTNPQRMIDANDGGVDLSNNGGETWFAPPLPICQFYHISADNRVPYHVGGNIQDIGTAYGPSNSLSTAGIALADWYTVGGGETGFTVPDPTDPNIIYAGEYGGYISRFDYRTRQAQNISVYPFNPSGHAAEALRYRFQWTAPILISPHDPKTVYHAANVLFRTRDGGKTWTPISPDLTRNDKSKQKWSGGPITGDNTGAEVYGTIFALAESPKEPGVLWAGSDDGLVHISRDNGKNWTNITANIPGLPEWGTVACIEASSFDPGTAYVVVDAHRLDDMRPYLWKTTDYGQSWTSLTSKLPQDVYLHVVREDPKQKGVLYLGTERGVSFSTDGGATWKELKLNLPTVAVHDLVVKDNDLVVGTNGRSIWIFDDLTPIRRMNAAVAEEGLHLFPCQPAIRWRYHSPVHSTEDRYAGENPPRGAIIHYHLPKKPKDPITLQILDAQGNLVNELDSKDDPDEIPEDDPDAPFRPVKKTKLGTEVGVNRVVWDLHYRGAEVIKGAKVDAGDPKVGPLVNPGTYTLRLTVDGQTRTTTVEVKPDPRVQATTAELNEQLQLALAIRDDITQLTRIVNQIRAVRNQLNSRNDLLKDDSRAEPLIKASKDVIGKLDELEGKLHNPKARVVYDILALPGGARLYSQLTFLLEALKDSDGAPTQGIREQYAERRQELRQYEAEWKALISGELARLNELARKLEVPGVIVPAGKTATPTLSEPGRGGARE
ncbi:MAG TPA: hypothetical protein VNK04_06905 [Gemmataceae bacterium]|nr:hypothetical protein [Gemmataceae bacterium]